MVAVAKVNFSSQRNGVPFVGEFKKLQTLHEANNLPVGKKEHFSACWFLVPQCNIIILYTGTRASHIGYFSPLQIHDTLIIIFFENASSPFLNIKFLQIKPIPTKP
jgi:hypothetical protein